MARTITISCTDAEAGSLSIYRGGDNVIHASKTFETNTGRESVDRTFAQLVTAAIITVAERTEYLRISQKINAGLRTLASLDP